MTTPAMLRVVEREVVPVMDIMDSIPIAQEAIEFRDSIS